MPRKNLRKGDRVEYTGEYDFSVPESAKYGPGIVDKFRNYGTEVTVRLEDGSGFIDWPLTECRLIERR